VTDSNVILVISTHAFLLPCVNVESEMSETGAMNPSAIKTTEKIFGAGEMADLIRDFDWSTTPVGPIEDWPEVLLIVVNTMLATRHPMFLWWGKELTQFYNDGYRPSIGSDKHPKALGQPGRECWP